MLCYKMTITRSFLLYKRQPPGCPLLKMADFQHFAVCSIFSLSRRRINGSRFRNFIAESELIYVNMNMNMKRYIAKQANKHWYYWIASSLTLLAMTGVALLHGLTSSWVTSPLKVAEPPPKAEINSQP